MANIYEFNEWQKKEWDEWVSSRPKIVQELAIRFPPNKLWKLNETNHRVTIISYSENGTMTVNVLAKYNFIAFERSVFGINPNDLTECELPDSNELLGAAITDEEEIKEFIEETANRINNK